jgi:hypothetical protein
MEIKLSETLPLAVPVPLYEAVLIGTAEQRGELFDIYLGLDRNMAEQVKKFSLDTTDTDLQENTSDYKRFGTGSYEEWYGKSRVPFALVHHVSGALAALIWFGPKPYARKSLKHLSEAELKEENTVQGGDYHTVVYRAYLPFRGAGLMKGFANTVTDVYLKYFPKAILWAGINRKNPASVALAEKLGYKIDESVSDDKWVAMVRK